MKFTFIISILIFLLIGCNSKSRKEDSLRIEYEKDSVQKAELELQLINDSIIKENEKVAISNINFGINRSTYKIKEKEFLKNCLNEEYNSYQIGSFTFKLIPYFTDNDSLCQICLEEYGVNSWTYESLFSVLKEKYSEPNIDYGLLQWNDKNPDLVLDKTKIEPINFYGKNSSRRYFECAIWEIGEKRIELRVYFSGEGELFIAEDGNAEYVRNSFKYTSKYLALVIYRNDVLQKLINKERTIQDSIQIERQKKEKEKFEEAVKLL